MIEILHVDDSQQTLEQVSAIIQDEFLLTTKVAQSGNQAIELLKNGHHFSIVISDLNMPDGNGIDVYNHISKYFPNTLFIFFTSDPWCPELPPVSYYCRCVWKLEPELLIQILLECMQRDLDMVV